MENFIIERKGEGAVFDLQEKGTTVQLLLEVMKVQHKHILVLLSEHR